MRRTLVGLALALAPVLVLAPVRGRADVVPYGWRPPPPAEETHVAMLRASIAEWMVPDERALLDARLHPRCVEHARHRSTGFGRAGGCPPLDRMREVAIDRAVRFFAAEILDAQGRTSDATALRDAPPMREAGARALASSHLTGDALEPARALAAQGMGWSLERIAAALGGLLHAAVRAGVPRARLTQAAIELLAELARPLATVGAWVEWEGGDALAAPIARRAGACLQPEADARWRPVAVRVVIQRSPAGLAVASTGPSAVRTCVERAVREGIERARGTTTGVRVARIVAGPRGVLWNAPVDLASGGR